MDCESSEAATETSSGEFKKENAKKLIERYYHQLTKGCESKRCDNENCASSSLFKPIDPNEAAVRALKLLQVRAPLCPLMDGKNSNQSTATVEEMEVDLYVAGPSTSSGRCSKGKTMQTLDEEKLDQIIKECEDSDNYSTLKQTLWDVFSNQDSLANSWSLDSQTKKSLQSKTKSTPGPSVARKLTKEEVRTLEGETEKDIDSAQDKDETTEETPIRCTVDLESLRRSYERLYSLDNKIFESGLVNALVMLCSNLEMDLKCKPNIAKDSSLLNVYQMIFEVPALGSEACLENVVPVLCRGVALLPLSSQVVLCRLWSEYSAAKLKSLLENLQQILSLKVYTGAFTRERVINEDETITSVTAVIRIVFYASLLGGTREDSDSWDTTDPDPEDPETDSFAGVEIIPNSLRERYHDPLGRELSLSPLDVRNPSIALEEFYNEPLNETIEMDKDFSFWKINGEMPFYEKAKFSFMAHPYILNPATKTLALYYDNRIRMYSERRMNLLETMLGAGDASPFLKLRVRRDRIILDAISELEMVVMENPKDLKKQLMVEFDSEQGIDEGGLSKEFFQLIVEEMFNPDYGMFIHDSESHTFWFNPTSFEVEAQFTIIGIVLGLAIYNNVILDLHLPSVIYRKLSGKKGTYQDLKDFRPSVYQGLTDMLNYDGDDFEDVFLQPFQISYTDLFGDTITKELCEGGEQRMVNKANVREYVDRYADFMLNKIPEKQFLAFQRGFSLVTAESPLNMMFTPTELEKLICGEKEFDFNELENSTEYDGGFSKESPCVTWFWESVHGMSLEDKRKLLQFTTGSDRIPVGGLARLKLIITKNGPDSDRLPSAHTCFNVLLLPEYSDKAKLNNLLMKAISECKGFGML